MVELAFALEEGIDDSGSLSVFDNYFGGKPVYPNEIPSGMAEIKCPEGHPLHLLVHLYAPLANSIYHRWIYVFGCNARQCARKQASFRVFRVMIPDDEMLMKRRKKLQAEASKQHQQASKKSLFGGSGMFGDNAWSTSKPSLDQLTSMLDKMELKNDKPAVDDSTFVSRPLISVVSQFQDSETGFRDFPAVYLEFDLDPKDNTEPDLTHAMQLLKEYQKQDPNFNPSGHSEDWSGESYEKSPASHLKDKHHKQFNKALERAPEQAMRYDLNGKPLLYANDQIAKGIETKGPKPCSHCGCSRRFELQLMPSLLSILPIPYYVLKSSNDETKSMDINAMKRQLLFEGMEWGTALVYTCSGDCSTIKTDTVQDVEHLLQELLKPIVSEEFITVQFEQI